MFASLPLLIFDDRNIILSDKTKNNVLQKGDFYRIYYSDSLLSLNGIYLHFNITDVSDAIAFMDDFTLIIKN